MAEWPIAPVLKTGPRKGFLGSNPSPTASRREQFRERRARQWIRVPGATAAEQSEVDRLPPCRIPVSPFGLSRATAHPVPVPVPEQRFRQRLCGYRSALPPFDARLGQVPRWTDRHAVSDTSLADGLGEPED